MSSFSPWKFAWVVVLLFTAAGVAAAQEKSAKKEVIQPTATSDGEQIYRSFCIACHGKSGTGDGPAASVLNTKPADLTTLAERHGGTFPDEYVAGVLRFGMKKPAHGTSDMPTWGPTFTSASGGDKAKVDVKIADLISYLKTLQKKTEKKTEKK
jgi:mono/diheme cytochrome c family protein